MEEGSTQPSAQELRDLCVHAAAGDEEAIERLLWAHHARFIGYAQRKIGVDWTGKIDAEDIVQEAYIDVFRLIGDFTPEREDSFYYWAARIVDHKFIDAVRRLRRKKRDIAREVARSARSSSGRLTLLERVRPNTLTPSRVMRHEDAVGAMIGCLARLPEDQRIAVTRLYLDQAPAKEVAEEMNRSEDAVRRLASRGVEKLREGMGRASQYLSQM